MRPIIAETLNQTVVGQQRVHLAERKGVGHPDSLGEAAMGEVARASCRGYQARAGRVRTARCSFQDRM
jgi:S-adenosylmethionine synthetase